MIVPRYWSEAKKTTRIARRQITLRRAGWSDNSEEEARQHAEQRLSAALEALSNTGSVRKKDRKVAYNGAEGLPIREEVISKDDDLVISRNSYGALCLNTPDVFFADIDFQSDDGKCSSASPKRLGRGQLVLALLGAGAFSFGLSPAIPLPLLSLAFLLSLAIVVGVWFAANRRSEKRLADDGTQGSQQSEDLAQRQLDSYLQAYRSCAGYSAGYAEDEQQFLLNIEEFSQCYPELHLRIYRTPMGYRVLCMNELFDPTSERTLQLLQELESDSLYVQMCRNQRCFRARISPKPWRINIDRLRPRPGVWPVKPEHVEQRQAWVSEYDDKAPAYASCHFVCQLGVSEIDPKADKVRRLHDDYCQALNTELPLA